MLLRDAVRRGRDTRIGLEDTLVGPDERAGSGQRGARARRPRVGSWHRVGHRVNPLGAVRLLVRSI